MAQVTSKSEQAGAGRAASRPAALWNAAPWYTKAIFVVACIGIIEAAYLTFVHFYGLKALACFNSGSGPSSCDDVQSSVYSMLVGIPVAVLGLLGYITIFASLKVKGDIGRAIGFGTSLIGFGFSMYLTYREIFTLHEICEWCVGSATWMTLLTIFTSIRFLRGE